jgi:tRNA(adenine34) deaminase
VGDQTEQEKTAGDDQHYMKLALDEAYQAANKGEVPVGAVIVHEGRVIARGHNLRERLNDPTAHAEMLAMRDAALILGSWRLCDCTLYVTMEPCPMCAGAAIQGRVARIVYGAADPKAGAAGSCVELLGLGIFNHRIEITGGVLAERCARVVQDFFRRLREADKQDTEATDDGCCQV